MYNVMGKVVKQIWLKNAKCYDLEKIHMEKKGINWPKEKKLHINKCLMHSDTKQHRYYFYKCMPVKFY